MTKQEKALKILQLALKINNTPTQQEATGNKPTVFVMFSGHVANFEVHIHLNGWEGDCDETNVSEYRCYLDESVADETLDRCIAHLKQIWQEWKGKSKNDTI